MESRAPVARVHDLLVRSLRLFVGILAPRGLESTVDAGQRVAMADNLGFGGGQFGQAGLDGGGCDKVSSQADVGDHQIHGRRRRFHFADGVVQQDLVQVSINLVKPTF